MIMRSAKVPLSPSSALQTMYFRSPAVSSTVFHLMPVGKPAPPRPRRPRIGHLLDDVCGSHGRRAAKAGKAAMCLIIFQRKRIDDAAAGEGQAGLFLEEWEAFDLPRDRAHDRRR